jgi:hypothetical protein
LPSTDDDVLDPGVFDGLQMLPNGSLIGRQARRSNWKVLKPGAGDWCTVDSSVLPGSVHPLASNGDRLWWEQVDTEGQRTIGWVSLADVRCG